MGCPVSDEAWAKGKEFAENTSSMMEYFFWQWVPFALAKAERDRAHAYAVGHDRAIKEQKP